MRKTSLTKYCAVTEDVHSYLMSCQNTKVSKAHASENLDWKLECGRVQPYLCLL